jgi:hypothetical protein
MLGKAGRDVRQASKVEAVRQVLEVTAEVPTCRSRTAVDGRQMCLFSVDRKGGLCVRQDSTIRELELLVPV